MASVLVSLGSGWRAIRGAGALQATAELIAAIDQLSHGACPSGIPQFDVMPCGATGAAYLKQEKVRTQPAEPIVSHVSGAAKRQRQPCLVCALESAPSWDEGTIDLPPARVHPNRAFIEAAELTTYLHEAGIVGVEKE
jgi:hypothetical protein